MTNHTARLSLTPTGAGSTVEVDGHPIRSARSLRLTTGVDQRTKLTLEQLGRRLGRATYQTVWQWESGTNEPKLTNLREWAAALGLELTLTAHPDPDTWRTP